jgi:serine/threonine protein kinase
MVYRARQMPPDRLVVLKVIRGELLSDAHQLARFRAAAETAAQLQHSHIAQVYEVGEHEGRLFVSLEPIDGDTLARKLAAESLPPRAAAGLLEQLAQAVHFAHQHGIVHGNLKPSDILFLKNHETHERHEKEKSVSENETERSTSSTPESNRSASSCLSCVSWLTPRIAGFGMGPIQERNIGDTSGYLTPEQADGQGREIGPLTDVYALGAIFYAMLTGQPPFRGATAQETLEQVCHLKPVPPRRLQPRIDHDLEFICLKCLEKEPPRRYASAAQLASELRRHVNLEPLRYTRPIGTLQRFWRWCCRRPVVAILAAVLLGLLVGGLAAATWPW